MPKIWKELSNTLTSLFSIIFDIYYFYNKKMTKNIISKHLTTIPNQSKYYGS
jgi:hypothetical protein